MKIDELMTSVKLPKYRPSDLATLELLRDDVLYWRRVSDVDYDWSMTPERPDGKRRLKERAKLLGGIERYLADAMFHARRDSAKMYGD